MANKKLIVAALSGILLAGSATACKTSEGSEAHGCPSKDTKSGCEAHSCKSSCKAKASCKSSCKSGCGSK